MKRESKTDTAAVADVEIAAAVRAKQLRFTRVPETEVKFDSARDSDSHTERENLPARVKPGVTYRDVRVRWRAGAGIAVKGKDALENDRDR